MHGPNTFLRSCQCLCSCFRAKRRLLWPLANNAMNVAQTCGGWKFYACHEGHHRNGRSTIPNDSKEKHWNYEKYKSMFNVLEFSFCMTQIQSFYDLAYCRDIMSLFSCQAFPYGTAAPSAEFLLSMGRLAPFLFKHAVTVVIKEKYEMPSIGKTLLGARTIYRELKYVQSVCRSGLP